MKLSKNLSGFQGEKTGIQRRETRSRNSLNKEQVKNPENYTCKQSQISVIFLLIQHNKGSINETVPLFQTLNEC